MLIAVFSFGSTAEASHGGRHQKGGFSQCVEVSHPDYPAGVYCPNEQAKARYIEQLKAKISYLQAQLSALLSSNR